jgi:hypothetical protein
MGRRLAELVSDEDGHEGVAQRMGGCGARHAILDRLALAARRVVAPGLEVAEVVDLAFVHETPNQRAHVVVQRAAARDDHAG